MRPTTRSPHRTAVARVTITLALGLAAWFDAGSAAAQAKRLPVVGPASGDALASRILVLDEGDQRRPPEVVASAKGWGAPPRLTRRSSSVWWVRFQFVAPVGTNPNWVLLPDPRWSHVEAWTEPAAGAPIAATGLDLVASRRVLPRSDLAVPLNVSPGAHASVLLRLEADFDSYAPPQAFLVEVRDARSDRSLRERSRALHGAYAGMIAALVLYNLFLGLALRDRTYLLYVVFIASFGLIWLAREGLAFELLWPGLPTADRFSTFAAIIVALAFGNLFASAFLELRRLAPVWDRLLRGCTWAAAATGMVGAAGAWAAAEVGLALVALASAILYPMAGTVAWRAGLRPARTFVVANLALVGGVVAYVLTYLRVLPEHPLTIYAAQVGSAVQVLLLAFALAERIRELRQQRDIAEGLVRQGLQAEVAHRTSELEAEKSRVDAIRSEVEEANRRLVDANRRLEEALLRDQLTGIPNRRRFDRALTAEWGIAQREGGWLALVLLDVDHFKAFNDRFGHQAGDRCLQRFARMLSDATRAERDLVARWGGEEFAILLPGVSSAVAEATAERMRTLIEQVDFSPEGSEGVTITASAGVAAVQPGRGAGSPEDLLRAADDALYRAKRLGRNRVVVAPPAQPPEVEVGVG